MCCLVFFTATGSPPRSGTAPGPRTRPGQRKAGCPRQLCPSGSRTPVSGFGTAAAPGSPCPRHRLGKKLGLPVSVFWHWWHGCAYDTGFPEYLPPREGAEAFQARPSPAAHDQRRSRPGLHEPAALGHDAPQAGPMKTPSAYAVKDLRWQGASGDLQHLHPGALRLDVHGHRLLAQQIRRAGRARHSGAGRGRDLHGPGLHQPGLLRSHPRPSARRRHLLDAGFRRCRRTSGSVAPEPRAESSGPCR